MPHSQIPSTINPLVRMKLLRRQQKQHSIIIHYTYEKRFAHYKSKIHQYWNATFSTTIGIDTKLIVGTRNNPNLTQKLVRRSPFLQKRLASKQISTAWTPLYHELLVNHTTAPCFFIDSFIFPIFLDVFFSFRNFSHDVDRSHFTYSPK